MGEISSIKIQNLSYCYPEAGQAAIENCSLEIAEGEFVVIAGNSGSGKSTLLRVIAGLIPDFYNGTISGKVFWGEQPLAKLSPREMAQKIGIVFQNPESQLVMMKVEQEIVFGMENCGFPDRLMKRRLMEVSSILRLGDILDRATAQLSAGFKQRIALAGVLAMQPEVLLLDEPTSQLDPITAEVFLNFIRKLNQDNGITVIIVEQNLEKCCYLADRIIVMDKGQVIADLPTYRENGGRSWLHRLPKSHLPLLPGIFAEAKWADLPLTIKEGRKLLHLCSSVQSPNEPTIRSYSRPGDNAADPNDAAVELQNLWFTYSEGREALKDINLQVRQWDFVAILGENGAGKSTLLKNINGLLRPGRGKVKIRGRDIKEMKLEDLAQEIAYLSQDPNDYLFMPSVHEELDFSSKLLKVSDLSYRQYLIDNLKLERLMDRNPRDLSAGEKQRVALASILLAKPRLLLLDEPTRGLDQLMQKELGVMLKQLNENEMTIVLVTHDMDFAAEYANFIVLMHNGAIIEQGSKYEVLEYAAYYSSQIARLFHNIKENVVTRQEAVIALREMAEINSLKKDGAE